MVCGHLGCGDNFGKLPAFDGETAYGAQTYYTFLKNDKSMQPDTHEGHLHQKYSSYVPGQFPTGTQLFAKDNRQNSPAESKDVHSQPTATSGTERPPFNTVRWCCPTIISLQQGWKDSEKIFVKNPHSNKEAVLDVISTTDGRTLSQYPLEAEPVFDGMAATYGRLYLPLKDGKIRCMAGTVSAHSR